MLSNKWLIAAGLAVALPGCVETNGYPTTSYGGYGGYPSGYGYNSGYYAQPAYYPQPTYYQTAPVVTQTRYVPVPVASPPQVVTRTQYVPVPTPTTPTPRHRDRDSDRRDSDKNGDGIPDRLQRNR